MAPFIKFTSPSYSISDVALCGIPRTSFISSLPYVPWYWMLCIVNTVLMFSYPGLLAYIEL